MKILRILGLVVLAMGTICQAQITSPGWYFAFGKNVLTPVDYSSQQVQARALALQSLTIQSYPSVAETITPEIQALARGLQNDPVQIYNYVHDHIRHVFYFGSKKGAQLTLLEKSGNDFDQCALLVAMLRAAGYSPTYEFGLVEMPFDATDGTHNDLRHWLQLSFSNTVWTNTVDYFYYFGGTRGQPMVANYGNNYIGIKRVWVNLSVGTNNYVLDPAFKVSEWVPGIANLTTAMNLTSNGLLSAAGGSDTGSYVTNLSEANLRGVLTTCTTNLLAYLQSNYPNYSVSQVVGGWQIVPSTNTTLPKSLLFDNDTYNSQNLTWSNEPTNLMASLQIRFANTNYFWYMPQFQGQRLSLTYSTNGIAQLWQDDALLVSNTTAASDTSVVLAVNHPFGSWNVTSNALVDNGNYDSVVTNTFQRTNATYVITYGFEPDWDWLSQRQQKLDAYRQQGLADNSRQVICETLNIMQLSWMLQCDGVEELVNNQLGTLLQNHHRFGRIAQESGHGYYVDAYMVLSGSMTSAGYNSASIANQYKAFDIGTYFDSALEHGIIEQMQSSNLVASSTVKMLQLGSTNGKAIYLASLTNWTVAANVKSKLLNYDNNSLNLITSYINAGFYILLPQNGSNHISGAGSWAGYGMVAHYQDSQDALTSMTISGGYNGGYASFHQAVIDINATYQAVDSQPDSYNFESVFTYHPTGADPVDMANGTFLVEHTDLSLGQAEPRGITLSRSYNSARRNSNPAGMAGGWLHNYYATAATVSAPKAALGGTTPQQMAPMIVASYAASTLYNGAVPSPKNWTVTALIAKWGIDQLYKNSASISLGKETIQFVKQPDGSFTPPANCTMTLTQTNSAYRLSLRHGNTFQFDGAGHLTNIVDQYNQNLKLTYGTGTASNLVATVSDWKSRSLTFNYIGGQLTSVSDNSSPSRKVVYSYSSTNVALGDLTSFTDAEEKATSYLYDTNHQITVTKDALNQIVVSNIYDGFGHVATQYTQGDLNKRWQIYWSRWQTVVEDPVGAKQTYIYDDQSRIVSQQDALGHVSQTLYDGQSHVVTKITPLNEISRFIFDGNHNLIYSFDPLGNTNQFFYDNKNNLIRSVDPVGNPTTFGYNDQCSKVGQTNGTGDWVSYGYFTSGTSTGALNTRTDAGGTTTYGYDAYGILNSITYPGSLGGESFVNNSLGDQTSHTDGRGFVTSSKYNNRRELTNTVVLTNITVSVAFDAVGNVSSLIDARFNTTSNTWSSTRKLISTTLPPTPQGVPIVTNGYDSRDFLVRSVDALGMPTIYTIDLLGRVYSVTDPIQRTTTFSYDDDGRKLASTNAASEVNSQTWDKRGGLLKVMDGAGHFSTRVYDAAGNQIYLTNRNGFVWQFQFDGANRLTKTITPKLRSTTSTFNHLGLVESITDPANHFTFLYYDAKGRLTNRTDVATTYFGYDANDNRTNVIENGKTNTWTLDGINRVESYKDTVGNIIQYRYDANGNLTNLIYPGNRTVVYAYDSLNRMTNVTDWTGRKSSITYDLNSHIRSIKRPNGSYRTIGYDAAGQATNILEQMANGLPIAIFNHSWTNTGSMAWEFAAPLPHVSTAPQRKMKYDEDNRLSEFQGPSMGGYQSVGTDADGNITSAPLTNDTFVSYNFDVRNRLLNAGGITNTYDAINNRIGQSYGTNNIAFLINPNAKLPQVLMRIKNGVTNYYIYGIGLLYQITETATMTNTLTYHYDYRGSTVALSADSGLVTDRIEYSAYGLTTYRTGASDTPFLFNGRYGVETDSNGLLYMRARYYNPYLCRFISADPSGFAGGLNLYAYANGNPVSLLDPFGMGAIGDSEGYSWIGRFLNSVGNGLEMVGQGALATLGYIWTSPNTAVGLIAGGVDYLAGLALGTHPGISLKNNAIQFLNLPWGTGGALTLGNTQLYNNSDPNTIAGRYDNGPGEVIFGPHEQAHTYQYGVLGPLFLPVYFIKGGISSANPFEVSADNYAQYGGSWWP